MKLAPPALSKFDRTLSTARGGGRVEDVVDAEGDRGVGQEIAPTPARSFDGWCDRFLANDSLPFLIVARFWCFRRNFGWLTKLVRDLPIQT